MLNIVDVTSAKSINWYFRKRRMKIFFRYVDQIQTGMVSVLDIGGTVLFWKKMGVAGSQKIDITLLNIFEQSSDYENIHCIVGDATDMNAIPQRNFDIVFSNSVIEHLGSLDSQIAMAKNIQKIAAKYFVQTPNYNFPIEPHFLFPFFHYLPNRFKLFLLKNFSLGNYPVIRDKEKAQAAIDKIRLLHPKELKRLFPTCQIMFEKFLFFNKSIIAHNLN